MIRGAQLYAVRWIASTAVDTPADIDRLCAAVSNNLATLIRQHADSFPDELPAGLPPERDHDHKIELEPGAQPAVRTQWRLTQLKLDELRCQLDYLLEIGFVRPSNSPFAAPILFTPKKDGGLRMCIDYRALNRVAIKSRYPIPRADKLIDQLRGAKFFSKIDLQGGYHQIRVNEADCYKTAFWTRYGGYEYTVMPFGLTNAPSTFQLTMNEVFRPLLEKCVIVYLDDIQNYSPTREQHLKDLEAIFSLLQQHRLITKGSKCEFLKQELEFLGHVISIDGGRATGCVRKAQTFPDYTSGSSDCLQPIAYESRKLNPAKRNYPVHDKDLLAIVHAFKVWRCYLTGADVTVRTNHKSLKFIRAKPTLNSRQIRWLDYLESNFHYRVTYKRGVSNIADALTRPSVHTCAADEVQQPSRQVEVAVSEEEMSGVTEEGGAAEVEQQQQQHESPPRVPHPPERPRRDVRPPVRLTYGGRGKPNVVQAGSVVEQIEEDEIAHCYWAPIPEPKTREEALNGPNGEKWKASEDEEFGSLIENETWDLCDLPPGKKAITSKMIYRHKYGPEGELTRYKSRLVARGFQQTKGKDYDEVFAPVGKGTTLRVLLAIAALLGWKIRQMDIVTAFLNGIIMEEVYMKQPEGLDDGSGRVCRLKKAIYGLKQAPRACAEQMLEMQFKCSKMGEVKYYLGMHVERDVEKGVLRLHQRKYCEGLAEKYGLQDGGKPATPLPSGFTVEPCADEENPEGDRDPRFTSSFWTKIWEQYDTRLHLSTAYDPQTDDQTELINKTMEQLIRTTCTDPTQWEDSLPLIKFAYNNASLSMTAESPFSLNYGLNPTTPTTPLVKSFVRPSTSPFAAPIMSTPKKDDGLRMCIDYRALNRVTIKSRYPIPRADELIDQLRGAKLFSKIDRRGSYHQIRISDMCEFLKHELEFLGHVISVDGVKIDQKKIATIQDWKPPADLRELQNFMGFVNYVRRFIPNMVGLTSPLTDLLKRGKYYEWGGEQQAAFEQLKLFMTTPPVLRIADSHRPFELITDANDLAVGAVLLQDFGEGLQPIAYELRKLNPAERNYPVHDKELLAIVHAFNVWRCYLTGVHVTIRTDHKSL
ncbi:hypothetical protein CLOM_g8010 [Closterium sp. NIES-68]|nr:hypothetical protein CLOM_g8010 [Closterium sp. NIES-68]